tara:strand:- start:1034 stop:1264 length:231 start_codon:yes stop_codon:yes gene_type:complete
MKTILQINESQFRQNGKHGDMLISILKNRSEDIKGNVMLIRTNLAYNHDSIEILAFNHMLRDLRRQNIIAINVILD